LAQRYGVSDEQLLVGRGSDEAIDLLVRAFCRAGQDAILICPPTFGMYQVCAAVQNASVQSVPLDPQAGFSLDFARLAAAVTPATKLIFLCSPNNPTGGVLPRAQVLDFVQHMAGRALVVVDEAYVEFSDSGSISDALNQYDNLAVLRTLSKAFALAGARIGCLLAHPQVITLLRKIMAPYPLPQPCVDAALLALVRAAAVDAWVSSVRAERERVHASLRLNPAVLQVWPSQANFLAFRVADATQTWRALAQRGIVVRDVSHYLGLAGSLRVSIGTPTENDAFVAALKETV
jgi:histidinol-phosphate aminotransferase